MNIPELKLNTGAKIPAIGFGTWALSAGREAESAVSDALAAGYRLIDTAKLYANEESVGAAMLTSDLPRQEIFLTTKLWNSDQGYESAIAAFNQSLSRLGMDYVDLYLIHSPNGNDRHNSWRALEKIYKDGRSKTVGVSNYSVQHLEELLAESDLVPAVNQIEFHPFLYGRQKNTLEFCKAKGIVVEAYSPLSQARQIGHPAITSIAKRIAKTNAQVMLRWAIQHGTVPIPKSSDPGRMKENLEVFDFELSPKDMAELNSLSAF